MVFKKIKNKYKTSRKTSYVLVVTRATPFPPSFPPPHPHKRNKQTKNALKTGQRETFVFQEFSDLFSVYITEET